MAIDKRHHVHSLITYSTIPFQMTPNSKWHHSYNKCRLKNKTIRLHVSFNMWKIPRTLLVFISKFFSIVFCMLRTVSNYAPFLFSSTSSIAIYHLIRFQFPHFPHGFKPRLFSILACFVLCFQFYFYCHRTLFRLLPPPVHHPLTS